MNILFLDACVKSGDKSRTRRLANTLLSHLKGDVTRVLLNETDIPTIDETAINKRFTDGKSASFDDKIYDLAKQFATADAIVIAAPFWDLSFPAVLKRYIEAVTVTGITFRYSENGIPDGLCRAASLYYVTSAGGTIFNDEYGYGYIKILAQGMYGIKECHCFKAENLDIVGADTEKIMSDAEKTIDEYFNAK